MFTTFPQCNFLLEFPEIIYDIIDWAYLGLPKCCIVGYSLIGHIYKWPWLKCGLFYIYYTCIFSDTWPHVLTAGWRHVLKYMHSYSVESTSLYARSNRTFPAILSEWSSFLHLCGPIWNTINLAGAQFLNIIFYISIAGKPPQLLLDNMLAEVVYIYNMKVYVYINWFGHQQWLLQ